MGLGELAMVVLMLLLAGALPVATLVGVFMVYKRLGQVQRLLERQNESKP